MILMTILALVLWNFKTFDVMNFLASHTIFLHKTCESLTPISDYQDFYKALVCGTDLPPSQLKEYFKMSGLLHLIVVSGSHLIFILFFYEKLFSDRFRYLKVILLTVYTFITGLQPPTVRALVGIGIRKLNDTRSYFWDSVQISWITGVLTLVLYKNWSNSFS